MPEEAEKSAADQKKDEDKVVLHVDMHCEGCKVKVRKALKDIPGAENIDLDLGEQKVTVKGKVDAKRVFETVKKKCGKRTLLLFPQPQNEEPKKEEDKQDQSQQPSEVPIAKTEVKVKMHCLACAKDIKKRLLKLKGVIDVNEDLASDKVVIKGRNVDAQKVCSTIKKSGRSCEIIPPPPEPAKAEEKNEENKEEKKEDGKEEDKTEEKGEKSEMISSEDVAGESKMEIRKLVAAPHHSVTVHYVYPPTLFSDENPNACSIM